MEFIEFNNNPKNINTADCAIRSISLVTDKTWEEVYRELAEMGIKNGFMLNDTRNISNYLESLGYKKQEIKRNDNTRYTVEEFCTELAVDKATYLIDVVNHKTVVKDKKLFDTWDCSEELVKDYWTKENITLDETTETKILKQANSKIRLEIYEVFAKTDFVKSKERFLNILADKSNEEIKEELERIKINIDFSSDYKYTDMEKIGYKSIATGFIVRLHEEIKGVN